MTVGQSLEGDAVHSPQLLLLGTLPSLARAGKRGKHPLFSFFRNPWLCGPRFSREFLQPQRLKWPNPCGAGASSSVLARTHRPFSGDVVSVPWCQAQMELFPEQIPSSGSFYFFFPSSFQHLFANLSVLCLASRWQFVLASLGSRWPEGTRTVWGQGQAAQPARERAQAGGSELAAWGKKHICVYEWKWPWGKILERTGWPVLLLSVCLSLWSLSAPARGHCAV